MRKPIRAALSLAATAILFFAFGQAEARILNVPDDYQTIQAGIDSSADGDTVLVQPGIYDENIRIRERTLVLASLVLTTGDPAYTDSTIIDGGARDRTVVSIFGCRDSTTAITGFTITNGNVGGMSIWNSNLSLSWLHITRNRGLEYGDHDFDDIGAGIGCGISEEQGDYRIYLNHSRLSNNSCLAGGFGGGSAGGIKSIRYNMTLNDVEIDYNEGLEGGGALFLASSEIILKNVSVHDNTSRDVGGGISINCGAHVIGEDVKIFQNSAQRDGGGCYAEGDGRFTLFRSQITGNSAGRLGGGFSLTGNLGHTFTNCVIANNDAPSVSSLVSYSRAGVEFKNTIIYSASEHHIEVRNGQCTVAYCDISGGRGSVIGEEIDWLDGNIDSDPLFRDPDNGDYHLTADSPCIDAGDPRFRLDPDGTITDISAYFWDTRQDPPSIVYYFPEVQAIKVDAGDTLCFSVIADDAEGDSVFYTWRLNGDTLSTDSLLVVALLDTGKSIVECVVSDDVSANCHAWEVTVEEFLKAPSDNILHSSSFILHSAYPNPFNSSTTIRFSVGQFSKPVRLAAYDISGRLVADLTNSAFRNPHSAFGSVVWNAENLPGGIYFIKLESGAEVRTMKAVLLK